MKQQQEQRAEDLWFMARVEAREKKRGRCVERRKTRKQYRSMRGLSPAEIAAMVRRVND